MNVPDQYVVISHYQPPGDGPPIVHVWGPWTTRAKALAAGQRMRRADKREYNGRSNEVTYKVRQVLDTDPYREPEHQYLSTGCRHDNHLYCQSMTGQHGEKRPGRCKFCEALCVCPCHLAP